MDLAPRRRAENPPIRPGRGRSGRDRSIGDIRDDESAELARLIRRRGPRWEVGRTEQAPLFSTWPSWYPPPVGQVERALEVKASYRIESRSLVFQTDEVRELLALLAAVDDPADEVALITALRSPGLACSDADLADWRLARGQWRIDRIVPDSFEEHRVAATLRGAQLTRSGTGNRSAELVAQVVRERRLVG